MPFGPHDASTLMPAGRTPHTHQLVLSGPPHLIADGRVVELATRDALLLAWLAIEGPTPRLRLAQLCWPHSDDAAARNALRQRLFLIRRHTGVDLVVGRHALALAPGVGHDLADADQVLPGVVGLDLDGELAAWLAGQRSLRRDRCLQALADRADRAAAAGDWADALRHARELLVLQPLSEAAHRRLMRLHYLNGDRTAALLAFDACERALKHEVGTRPSAETLALLATVERATAPALPARPLPPPPVLQRPPRLVGRDAAWAALGDAVACGARVVVEAEAGLGKSRLVGDFARPMGPAAVLLKARAGDTSAPYAVVVRLLRALVQTVGAPPAPLRRRLARWLPEFGDPDRATAGPAPLHAALRAFLAASAQAGLRCVIVEDVHHIDGASAEALHEVADAETRLAWVFTTRPPGASGGAPWPGDRRIALAPLGRDALAELVDSLALPGWSGRVQAPRLLQHTGGNPLFVLETLKTLPHGAPGDAWPAPASVAQLVRERLTRLSPPALRVVRCAALAGPDFSVELAERVLDTRPLDLADAWAELEAAHVLHDLRFAHDLVHDAARDSVPAPLARELHRQIAEHLEAHGAPPERLAAHWQASATPRRAVPHLVDAGRRAAALLRWNEAADRLLAAAELLDDGGDRDAAFTTLLSCLESVRRPLDVNDRVCDRLDALAQTPEERARVAHHRAGGLTQRGDFDAATRVAEQALAGWAHDQAPVLAAMLMLHTLGGPLQRGDTDAALGIARRIVALTDAADDDEARLRAVSALAMTLNMAGRTTEAAPHFVHAVEIAQRRGDPCEIVEASLELVSLRQACGDIAAARRSFEQAERVARQHELAVDELWPWMALRRVQLACQQADYAAAVDQLETARAVLAQRMPGWAIAGDHCEAVLWMHLGQWARARQASQAALSRCDEALPLFAAQARAAAVELDRAVGRRVDGVALLDDALQRLGAGSPRVALQLAIDRSRWLEPPQAQAAAARQAETARARGWLGVALDAEVSACEAAIRSGDTSAASQHARQALALLGSVEPASLYRARVWLAAVQALHGSSPAEADRHLCTAVAWIRDTAAQRVPPAFRDSFLRRNPVNCALLARAARTR